MYTTSITWSIHSCFGVYSGIYWVMTLLDLIRKNAVYGSLSFDVDKDRKEWLVSCAIKHPAGFIASVAHYRSDKLYTALQGLIGESKQAYERMLKELAQAKQMEIDFEEN